MIYHILPSFLSKFVEIASVCLLLLLEVLVTTEGCSPSVIEVSSLELSDATSILCLLFSDCNRSSSLKKLLHQLLSNYIKSCLITALSRSTHDKTTGEKNTTNKICKKKKKLRQQTTPKLKST